ncbi:MAG: leucyl aminopeptidase, partial [Halieaceae bacterium]
MEFIAKKIAKPETHTSACAVVLVKGKTLSDAGKALDNAAGGLLTAAIKRGDLKATLGKTLVVQCPVGMSTQRVLLVNEGKGRKLTNHDARKLLNAVFNALNKSNCKDVVCYLSEIVDNSADAQALFQRLATTGTTSTYRYTETLSKKRNAAILNKVTVDVGAVITLATARTALARGHAIGNGTNTARELGNLPGNYCTPGDLAREAKKLASSCEKLSCKILEEKQMKALGMGSLLSVTAGTVEPAKLIVMEYNGGSKKSKPIVLVGKGITFDSGGISLKPGGKMDEMKFDMCGAASVFGT